MSARAVPAQVPAGSLVAARLPGAYFHDSLAIEVADGSQPALAYFLRAFSRSPAWVNQLMALRNRLVRLVGLKNLGSLAGFDPARPAADYRIGERIGIFTLISCSDDEVLLGDQDKHLDVVVALWRGPLQASGARTLTVTTVVHVHNWLGRLYMLPVTPMHKLIAPAVLNQVVA